MKGKESHNSLGYADTSGQGTVSEQDDSLPAPLDKMFDNI